MKTSDDQGGWRERWALNANVVVLGLATFLLTFGHHLWFQFAPRYLEALGASILIIGLWGSLIDLLDAAWQYPGGALVDRIGLKRALLALTGLSLLGILLFLSSSVPVVLAGLVFYMASMAYAQPATFAVIGDALPPERRSMGFVVQSVLKRVPALAAPPVAGYLITERFGVLTGVRVALVLAGLLTVTAFAVQWYRYRELQADLGPPPSFRPTDLPPGLRRLLVSDILVRFGESMAKVFLILYVVAVLGYTDFAFGVLLALQAAVTLAVYVPAARAADRHGRKPWVALTFLFFMLHPLAVLLAERVWMLVVVFVLGGLREIGEPARKATIVDWADPARRGRVVGTYYTIRGLVIVPAALAAALLWDVDPRLPFLAAGLVGAAGLVVYGLTVPHERTPKGA